MNLAEKLRAQMGISPNQEQMQQMNIQYGHDGARVAMIFPAAVSNVLLTPAEVDAMIDGLTKAKEMLEAGRD